MKIIVQEENRTKTLKDRDRERIRVKKKINKRDKRAKDQK